MRRNLKQIIGSLTGIFLFGISLWILHHLMAEFHYSEVAAAVHALSWRQIAESMGLTALNYAALGLYDVLAVRYVGQSLPWRQVGFASMVSYAFSNTVGLSVLTSGSVRYRFYAAWGLSPTDIARIVLFSASTLWLGILSSGGILLLFSPETLSRTFGGLDHRLLGLLFLAPPMGYLSLCLLRRRPLRVRRMEVEVPRTGLALAQLAIGALDWILAGSVLFFLLPPDADIALSRFLGVYLVAQTIGLFSHVPGGLGVFESAMLLLLPHRLSPADMFGTLLAYRLVYYLLPLAVAAVALLFHEGRRHWARIAALSSQAAPWLLIVLPWVFAVLAFVSGAVLLFSAVTPVLMYRMAWLQKLVPLPVVEVSHFLASLVGVALLLLGRGLQERVDAAWLLAVILLTAGIPFSLLKGGDYEEAIILAVLLTALLPCRREFYRKSSLLNQPFTVGWITSIVFILACTLWLAFFSHKHLEYAHLRWWSFSFGHEGHGPRVLRAMVGMTALALFAALVRLLRPAPAPEKIILAEDWPKIRKIVAESPQTYAHLALLGDKSLLLSENRRAFIMYAVEGNSCVAMGDPVGAWEEKQELAWRFREMCEVHGVWSVFYQVGSEYLELYIELGLVLHKIGEEARVRLAAFSLEGKSRKSLRNLIHRLEKEGYRFEIIASEDVPGVLPDLRRISDAWLAGKGTREKKFSLGFFNEDYLKLGHVALVRRGDEILAFANLWLGTGKTEVSIDLMRYEPRVEHGIMDYLLTHLLLWSQAQRYTWFNLGVAPLSGLENRGLAPLWNRFGALVYGHGGRFYNFQGVRQYKEKFDPVWEPRYLAIPSGASMPRTLVNLSTLIAGGIEGALGK